MTRYAYSASRSFVQPTPQEPSRFGLVVAILMGAALLTAVAVAWFNQPTTPTREQAFLIRQRHIATLDSEIASRQQQRAILVEEARELNVRTGSQIQLVRPRGQVDELLKLIP